MSKTEKFDDNIVELSKFAKAISHPARLAILHYLSESKTCISGDISDFLPLSRSTVFQHLKELKELGLIHGEIDGLKVNYCLCVYTIEKYKALFDSFFDNIDTTGIQCGNNSK
jgi:DNA-binding transcriptional ArsR family regulator